MVAVIFHCWNQQCNNPFIFQQHNCFSVFTFINFLFCLSEPEQTRSARVIQEVPYIFDWATSKMAKQIALIICILTIGYGYCKPPDTPPGQGGQRPLRGNPFHSRNYRESKQQVEDAIRQKSKKWVVCRVRTFEYWLLEHRTSFLGCCQSRIWTAKSDGFQRFAWCWRCGCTCTRCCVKIPSPTTAWKKIPK